MATRYGVFDQYDEFVSIGTFESDTDAYIAISEHGLDMELGEEYYVAPVVAVQNEDDDYTVTYEPGELCGYCGDSSDPNDICYQCWKQMKGEK